MESANILQSFKPIQLENPVDTIIRQLKHLIVSGQLKSGDRLPSERILAERFGVGRSYVREAIMKLEFFGLIKISPQSGTYVSGYSLKILNTLFTDIINLNRDDFASLIEARYHIEIVSARLAAERRTEKDLLEIENAISEYDSKIAKGLNAVDEDMVFHLHIAKAAANPVIESLTLILIPDIIKNIVERKICSNNRERKASQAHYAIYQAIADGNANQAAQAMSEHLNEILQISKRN